MTSISLISGWPVWTSSSMSLMFGCAGVYMLAVLALGGLDLDVGVCLTLSFGIGKRKKQRQEKR